MTSMTENRAVIPSGMNQIGRNLGLYNEVVRETLFFVCQSEKPLTSGRIAQQIRQDERRRMSNEYKIIKRSCPPVQTVLIGNPRTRRYLDIVPGDGRYMYVPTFRGFLLYLYNEYRVKKDDSKDYEKKGERDRQHLRPKVISFTIFGNFTANTYSPNILFIQEKTVSGIHLYP